MESDVARAQSLIAWADHLVFIYPTWWGSAPACLKALLDRCLTPGFAFRHRKDGSWDKLLAGKTAQLLTTMDTPPWVHRFVYGSPGFRMLHGNTLHGIRGLVRSHTDVDAIDPIGDADDDRATGRCACRPSRYSTHPATTREPTEWADRQCNGAGLELLRLVRSVAAHCVVVVS